MAQHTSSEDAQVAARPGALWAMNGLLIRNVDRWDILPPLGTLPRRSATSLPRHSARITRLPLLRHLMPPRNRFNFNEQPRPLPHLSINPTTPLLQQNPRAWITGDERA
ncbi:unnamed protein product [Pleuronectes platessa]|uniref:Uncharacterized protein n=1 Tax=Pleuronectes platessa TaxID=8262 RepID=A0A9N7TK65_PLEPL|nr:unnamed protein product [Pleuronectes platessa]